MTLQVLRYANKLCHVNLGVSMGEKLMFLEFSRSNMQIESKENTMSTTTSPFSDILIAMRDVA